MRLLRRDLMQLYLFKPVEKTRRDGTPYNTYPGHYGVFYGHIQPLNGSNSREEYGVDLKYGYCMFVEPNTADMAEMDRVGVSEEVPEYEIKTIRKWRSHWLVFMEEIRYER